MEVFNIGNMTALIIIATTLVTIKLFYDVLVRKRSKIPGPWGLPLVGHLPFLGSNPAKTFMKMRKKYGNVLSIRMGSWPTVILNSRQVIREAFVNNSDVFADRPNFFSMNTLGENSVAFGKYGAKLRLLHRIAVDALKRATSKKTNQRDDIIATEIGILMKELQERGQESGCCPSDTIFFTVGAIIYQICLGKDENCRYDDDFKTMVKSNKEFGEVLAAGNPLDLFPWVRFFMKQKYNSFKHLVAYNTEVSYNAITNYMGSKANDDNENIADVILNATKKYSENPDLYHGITKTDIYTILRDLIVAGYDTVSTTMDWAFLYLSVYPNIQRKIQMHIDSIIGSRTPKIEDRPHLPYIDAVILEVFRHSYLVPLSLPHYTSDDVLIDNHLIKKGTLVFGNFYATTRDPDSWDDPEEFRPERFLDQNNRLILSKAEEALTFGLGCRRCPGEKLAYIELFLIFANIFQRYQIELTSEPDLEGIIMLQHRPSPYKIKVTSRTE